MFALMVGDRDDYLRLVNCINDLAPTWRAAVQNEDEETRNEFFSKLHLVLYDLHRAFNEVTMQHGRYFGFSENKKPPAVSTRRFPIVSVSPDLFPECRSSL